MIDSRIWEKEWADARIKGIDGFTVGFQPGKTSRAYTLGKVIIP